MKIAPRLLRTSTGFLAAFVATLVAADAGPRPEGYTRDVEAVLGSMVAAYRDASSYQDNGRLTVLQQTGRVRQITKMPSSTAMSRPGKLAVLGGMQSITCDGEQLQISLDALKQFQQKPAPEKLTMEQVRMGAPGAGLDQGYPEVLEFLLGDNIIDRWMAQVREIAIVNQDEPAVVAERECLSVSYKTIHGAEINLFIDAKSFLLLRCDIDNTNAQRGPNTPNPGGSAPPKVQVVLQFDPVEVGAEIEDKAFALSDPTADGLRLVEAFEATPPGGSQPAPVLEPSPTRLVGTVAPAFQASTGAGKTISPETLAGKPALLFFWSPNAGPGNLAAVQMVERLRSKSEKDGVAILGVAAIGSEPQMVSDLMAAKKTKYHSSIDTTGDIARSYSVNAFPAWVVIGADGKVRHATSGDPRQVEQELAQQLQSATAEVATAQTQK